MRRFASVLATMVLAILLGLAASVAAAPLGDCTLEPQLSGRTDIVFCEPWERTDWYAVNRWQKSGARTVNRYEDAAHVEQTLLIERDPAKCRAGSCLRVRWRQFWAFVANSHWHLKEAGLAPERLFLRYYIKIDRSWAPQQCESDPDNLKYGQPITGDNFGGKLPGIHDLSTADDVAEGSGCGNGGAPGDGITCWSGRGSWTACPATNNTRSNHVCETVPNRATRIGTYLYAPSQTGPFGAVGHCDSDREDTQTGTGGTPQFSDRATCSSSDKNFYCYEPWNGQNPGTDMTGNRGILAYNRWYAIEWEYRMNTPGVANGVIRGWVDGRLAYQKTNVIFRLPGHRNLHARAVWLSMQSGGLDGLCREGTMYLDQLVIATDGPIGVLDPGPESSERPAAPSELTTAP